jgi:RecA/RadA recombinase
MAKGAKKNNIDFDDVFIGKDRLDMLKNMPRFDTNIIPFDEMLGHKGMTYGDLIAIHGSKGCGKSTIYSQVIKNMMDIHDFDVYYIDTENSFWNQAEDFGLIPYIEEDKLKISCGEIYTIGQLEAFFKTFKDKEKHSIVVVDSVSQLLSDEEFERDINNQMVCSQAKDLTLFLKKVKPLLSKYKVIMMAISQQRDNMDRGTWGKHKKMAGCNQLQHAADIIIELKNCSLKGKGKIFNVKSENDKVEIGKWITMSTDEKNKKAGTTVIHCPFLQGKGISNILYLNKMLVGNKYVTQAGAYYKTDIVINPDTDDGTWNLKGGNAFLLFIKNHYDEIYDILKKDGHFDIQVNKGNMEDMKIEF